MDIHNSWYVGIKKDFPKLSVISMDSSGERVFSKLWSIVIAKPGLVGILSKGSFGFDYYATNNDKFVLFTQTEDSKMVILRADEYNRRMFELWIMPHKQCKVCYKITEDSLLCSVCYCICCKECETQMSINAKKLGRAFIYKCPFCRTKIIED